MTRQGAAVAVLVALVMFAILQLMVLRATGGIFEYPLDDVYIHLAIGNSIARGEYGINPGEYASAGSSIIYPVILAPFAGLGIERFVPLLVNLLALIGIAITWAKVVALSGVKGPIALFLYALGPLALNFAGIAFTGMEHSLHVWASLAIFAGLIELVKTGRLTSTLIVATILNPLVRFEGLAMSLLSCGVIVLRGRPRAGLLVLGLTVLPIAGFVAFLNQHDIGPLPTSVFAKQTLVNGGELGILDRVVISVFSATHWPTGAVALIASVVLAGGAAAIRNRSPDLALLALVAAVAGIAHLVLGRFGWGYRYEAYVIAVLGAAWVTMWGGFLHNSQWRNLLILAFFAVPLGVYQWQVPRMGPPSARAIHLQQEQMARFAQEFLKAPVAVNDIGRVAWRNPNYVLDLYGLASRQALALRQDQNAPIGWAGPLASAKDVEAAMIYDYAFPRAVPPTWTKIAVLHSDVSMGWIVLQDADIYATSPQSEEKVRIALKALAEDLPPHATLVFRP